jgi:hypothetical protein
MWHLHADLGGPGKLGRPFSGANYRSRVRWGWGGRGASSESSLRPSRGKGFAEVNLGDVVRRSVLVAGVACVVVGVVLFGTSYSESTHNLNLPPSGRECYRITPPVSPEFGGTARLSWSGADPTFHLTIGPRLGSTCTATSALASGSGPSGSVSFAVTAGVTYVLNTTGSPDAVPATVQFSGPIWPLLTGIALALVGAGVSVLGVRPRTRPPLEPRGVIAPAARPGGPPGPGESGVGESSTSPPPPGAAPPPHR